MKQFVWAVAIFATCGAIQAQAEDNICSDLVKQAQSGLQANKLHDVVKDRLQQMLETGRSGNLLACQDVAAGSLSTPKPEATNCNKPTV
jgi:hypothetical protein